MAKDLRGFLESAVTTDAAKGSKGANSLAQRRSLTSPGEPRVFRVRQGFVCGLCGRLHGALERAFDCLGRCTIELRLRSPAGPSHQGSGTHFACTACGRGYVNCDDAEQCFERCLVQIKPTPQFELALRQVQRRYMQRLASHGLRTIERIDPLSEHKKMLDTLTKEAFTLGGMPPERNRQTAQRSDAQLRGQTFATPPSRSDKRLEASELGFGSLDGASWNESLETNTSSTPGDSLGEALGSLGAEGTGASLELGDLGGGAENALLQATSSVAGKSSNDVASMMGSAEPTPARSEAHPQESLLSNSLTPVPSESVVGSDDDGLHQELAAVSDRLNAQLDLEEFAPQQKAALSNGSRPTIEGASALNVLASTTPDGFVDAPAADSSGSLSPDTFAATPSGFLNSLGNTPSDSDSLGGAFEEAGEFAALAQQPTLADNMGTDILSLLQAGPEGEDLELDSKQKRLLQDKTLDIDTTLLDSLSSESNVAPEVVEVFVRKRGDNKPYRRNNALYTCRACERDHFTKELVEACFYSHPEEGSEEERMLREKVEKIKAKTAA